MDFDGFRVRGFRSDDLNKVMEINFECLPENYSSYFYRDLYHRFPKTFLVAEADGAVQGYIMCRIERGLSKLHSFRPARLCHVVSVAVREPYRRRGIATELILEAMRRGLEDYKATECFLEVRVSNEPAIRLYEKQGFTKVKRHRGYYMDGE
ncbi:MAG: GNAT family N-acetyltransferase, partial [Candidatus Bathyarchaeia archaeon]